MPETRYDPVWKRLTPDAVARRLEGAFPTELERLSRINNWGALHWLHVHATAEKRAHHWGVEHAAREFIDGDPARKPHAAALQLAAHALHWGHVPLAYQGLEALIRAADVSPDLRAELDRRIDRVVARGDLKCAAPDHHAECASRVRRGDRPFELYRWLSAFELLERWPKAFRAVNVNKDLDEDQVRHGAVRALVCLEDRGRAILDHCRVLDYTLRDLLQSGTATLAVDSRTLWETDPTLPNSAPEWDLIYAARHHLDRRFFETPTARLVHGLASRAFGHAVHADSRSPGDMLQRLLTTGDSFAESTDIRDYHRSRIREVKSTATAGIEQTWTHVGTFDDVSLPAASRLDLEHRFTERSGVGRLSYPFTAGWHVLVDNPRRDFWAGGDRLYATVTLHWRHLRQGSAEALPVLRSLNTIRDAIGPLRAQEVGNAFLEWVLGKRSDTANRETMRAAGVLSRRPSVQLRPALQQLRALKSAPALNGHLTVVQLTDAVIRSADLDEEFPDDIVGALVLAMPWDAARRKPAMDFYRKLSTEAAAAAGQSKNSAVPRGAALEVAVIADQLLSEPLPKHRMVFSGLRGLVPNGQPEVEFDVVRIDIADNHWKVVIVEASVDGSKAKADESRTRIDVLSGALQNRFDDLRECETLLASPDRSTRTVRYEEARRGWKRD